MCNWYKVYAYTSQLGGGQGRIGEKNRRMLKIGGEMSWVPRKRNIDKV